MTWYKLPPPRQSLECEMVFGFRFRFLSALLYAACVAAALFVAHHQLQVVYYRTCRANLIAVVLHHRSDVCYGLNMAITAIERSYQQGAVALMHWGVSVATILVPCLLGSTKFVSRNVA